MGAYYDLNHHFCCFGFTVEIIVPFDFVRWFLLKQKTKKSTLWLVNGLIEVHMYHMRSVIECLVGYELVAYREEFLSSPWGQVLFQASSFFIFFFYLTPYWTYWTTKQIYRELDSNSLKEKSNKQS
jgi:hypothetical protein